ncbi:FG-GAP repeat domain-containing protein [Saccharothrix lopnurensis]|uniref:FG-GAP repeat domain-containing protein n=1 Tax=Saccharothrix lopnurensis TaxID=1670621 RepID=A0ABW1NWJ4_9PSEU
MRRFFAVLGAAVMMVVLLTPPASAALPAPAFGSAIDAYAQYVGQSTCDPDAKPGVVGFRDILTAEYGRGGGISRECDQGGQSEHKEGRALDAWFDATNATQKAQAAEVLNWLFATDQHGNTHARVRRFGVMYIIWNHQIWRAYESSKGWQTYTGANPHTDHIHFSFSWAGARKQTTWWTSTPRGLAAESVNGDKYDDLLAVDPGGTLRVYPGTATGTFGGSSDIGPGWSPYNRIGVGDTNADGFTDILATKADGSLHYWHNSGQATFERVPDIGSGWHTVEWFAVLDVNGDNRADVVGRDGDRLYWYPGRGRGAFSERAFVGEGWATFPEFAGGDADGDGDGDLWGTNAAGELYFWEGNGNGTFSSSRRVGSGWGGFGPFNVMDINGDAKADLVAVRADDNTLWRWLGSGTGGFAVAVQVGFGWSGYRLAHH